MIIVSCSACTVPMSHWDKHWYALDRLRVHLNIIISYVVVEPTTNTLESSSLMLETEVRHQRYAMIAAVCATAILGIALFNRVSNTGPCTFNSFQRSAVCTKLSVLPGTIPDNTQVIRLERTTSINLLIDVLILLIDYCTKTLTENVFIALCCV